MERAILTQLVRDLTANTTSTRAILERLTEAAQLVVRAEGACVLELENGTARAAAVSGSTLPFAGLQFAIMPAPSLFHEAIETGLALFTNDGHSDARVDPRFRAPLSIQHAAVAPIIIGGHVAGLLLCLNSLLGGFTPEDMISLQRLADHSALALHSAQLVREAQDAAQTARDRAADSAREGAHLRVLARTAQVLANAHTRDELYGGLARIIEEELGGAGCSIYEADGQKRSARLAFQSGTGKVLPEVAAGQFWVTRLGDIVDSGQPLFVSDILLNSNPSELVLNEPLRQGGIESVAAMPLIIGDRTQGVLAIRYRDVRAFDEHERQLLTSFAAQIAVALRHVGYVSDLETRATRLAALAHAQQQLTRLVSRDTLLPAIANAVTHVVSAPRCDMFFPQARSLRCVFSTLNGEIVPTEQCDESDLELARASFVSGVARIGVSNIFGRNSGRRVELCAPIRFGEHSIGVLRLTGAEHSSFDLQDLDLVNILARHAGSVLETARLFGAQNIERQRAEAAADLARATLRSDRLHAGAAKLLAVLDRVVPTNGKAIGVSRGRDGRIEYVAASGSLHAIVGHRPAGKGGVASISPDGHMVEVETLRELAPEHLFDKLPDECALVVPLIARDRTLGVLLASMPAPERLGKTMRTTVERLSASLALACDALLLDEEERYARERERMLATALTTMQQPVFILDRQVVRYANPAALREYGWSLAEITGATLDLLVLPHASPNNGSEPAEGGDNEAFGLLLTERIHRRRDGTEFPAAMTQNVIASEDGTIVGQVVSIRNMTAEHEAEAQIRHNEKMVALGELVAGVAHEINNPLTGISAFAQLLLDEPMRDDQREAVQLIKRESDRATTVIRDLLLFARKEGATTGPVDINALLEQTVRLRAYQLRNANVEVTLVVDPTSPQVMGDRQKLQQVLLNVIINAEHALQNTGNARLLLRTAREGDRIIVDATDSGVGMSPEVRRRIFEPFYTTKPAGVGTGLGLSVSYGIIQAHQGTIEAHSAPGLGTTISIQLPAAPPVGLFADADQVASR
ncbi:MAG: GAF domain-containing protein [Gemmatimonadota bacterium]|nr:GAF domain-containing protein [Gemmatimonadota bacterium]